MLKAVIIGNKVLCGKCGRVLFILSGKDIEIKCKHRDKGETCNETNVFEPVINGED